MPLPDLMQKDILTISQVFCLALDTQLLATCFTQRGKNPSRLACFCSHHVFRSNSHRFAFFIFFSRSAYSVLSDAMWRIVYLRALRTCFHTQHTRQNFNCKSVRICSCLCWMCRVNEARRQRGEGDRKRDIGCIAIVNTIALHSNAIKWQATLSYTHSRKAKLF